MSAETMFILGAVGASWIVVSLVYAVMARQIRQEAIAFVQELRTTESREKWECERLPEILLTLKGIEVFCILLAICMTYFAVDAYLKL